jgi:hypothetical protein
MSYPTEAGVHMVIIGGVQRAVQQAYL